MRLNSSPESCHAAGMGRTVILTMPSLRAGSWLQVFRAQGIEALHWPASEIALVDGMAIHRLHERIAASDWVLLPSPSAVILLMQALCDAGLHWPLGCGVGLVGPGSQRVLQEWLTRVPGLDRAAIVAPEVEPFDAQALVGLAALRRGAGLRVLVLHRPDGQTRWLRALITAGTQLEVQAFYSQRELGLPESALAWLRLRAATEQPLAVSIASRGAGRLLKQSTARHGLFEWLSGQVMFTHHPAIASDLSALGFAHVLLHAPGARPLIEALRALESDQPSSS